MNTEAQVLGTERVEKVFLTCLFKDGEDTTSHVMAPGITTNVGFHPGRLKEHEEEIVEMLGELPDEFKESGGGGMSFLNACIDKYGRQWTSFHRTMEQLFLLGTGLGKVELCLPREMWGALPGGMPYYTIKDKVNGVAATPVVGKWKLEGYDTFEGGPDAYYSLEGEYDSEVQAEEAARARLGHLEETQPSGSSGGQGFGGIQDQVYIVGPDGKRRRFHG